MKDFMKAMKIYIRALYNPVLFILVPCFLVPFLVAMAVDPAKPGTKDYGNMIALVGMMHVFILVMFFVGNIKLSGMKFFGSLPQAKVLYTDVPIAANGILCLILDTVIFAIAVLRCGSGTAADLLIADAVNSVITCAFNASSGKIRGKVMSVTGTVMVCMYFNQMLLLRRISFINNGFGISLPYAAVIAAAVYVIGFAVIHFGMLWWWKKSDRNYTLTPNRGIAGSAAGNN